MTVQDEEDREPLSSRCVGTEACPKCGSPDNVKVYDDGHKKCWSGGCGFFDLGDEIKAQRKDGTPMQRQATQREAEEAIPAAADPYPSLASRNIDGKTLKKFGVYKGHYKGRDVLVHPIYDQEGNLAWQKCRVWGKKEFFFVPMQANPTKPEKCKMHGQQTYGERFDKSVTVAVGEFDWLSLAEAIPNGGAFTSIVAGDDQIIDNLRANYMWLDSFETIRLWFDADESGQKNLDKAAGLFKVGKVKICKKDGHKDANAAYTALGATALVEAYWGATTWRPRGLVNAAECLDDVLADDIALRGLDWPWPKLNDMTVGLRPGHVCYVVAGTGVGKTTALYEIEYKLLEQGAKMLIMGFEDMRRDIQLGLMTVHTNTRLSLVKTDKALREKAHKEIFGSGKVTMFDPETAEWSIEAILGYIRYAAKALECTVAVVDPLSFVAAGLSLSDDERRSIDHASREFAAMAKELGIVIIIAHHLKRVEGRSHEEGGHISLAHIRSSGGIANFASYVIGLERDQQSEDRDGEGDDGEDGDEGAGVDTRIRLLKNRPASRTGIADVLSYDHNTGRLTAGVAHAGVSSSTNERIAAQRKAAMDKASGGEL